MDGEAQCEARNDFTTQPVYGRRFAGLTGYPSLATQFLSALASTTRNGVGWQFEYDIQWRSAMRIVYPLSPSYCANKTSNAIFLGCLALLAPSAALAARATCTASLGSTGVLTIEAVSSGSAKYLTQLSINKSIPLGFSQDSASTSTSACYDFATLSATQLAIPDVLIGSMPAMGSVQSYLMACKPPPQSIWAMGGISYIIRTM